MLETANELFQDIVYRGNGTTFVSVQGYDVFALSTEANTMMYSLQKVTTNLVLSRIVGQKPMEGIC